MADNYNYIEIAKNNPDNKLTLDFGSGNLQLLIVDEVSLNLNNSFEAILNNLLTDAATKLSGGMEQIMAGIQQFTGTQKTFKSIQETILYWRGSDPLSFDFSTILIASKTSDNLLSQIQPLIEMTNPDFDPTDKLTVSIKAPLGYAPNLDSGAEGKVGIQIGRWFETPRVFVLTSAIPTISKAKLQDGKPLYITLRLSFKAFRMLAKSEVSSYFKY